MIKEHLLEFTKQLTVLCVEDDIVTLQRLQFYFKKIFKEVYTAKNGAQGLAKFKSLNPDIVVTDIQMPGLDGLDMTDQIKMINSLAKVLVVSAYDDKDYLIKSLNIGVDGYIKKPIDNQDLDNTLSKVIKSLALLRNVTLKEIQQIQTKYNDKKELDFCEIQDHKKLFETFSIMVHNEIPIKAITIYKGLMISHECSIVSVGNNKLFIIADKIQTKISMIEKSLIIHSDLFYKDIQIVKVE